jgi:hypothetical protein
LRRRFHLLLAFRLLLIVALHSIAAGECQQRERY